jgi:hypothetical protein
MQAFEEGSAKEKTHARATADGIDASGVICRRLAMGEVAEEESHSIDDSSSDNSGQEDQANRVENRQSSKFIIPKGKEKKRSRSSSGQSSTKKITKRERLDGVMDCVVQGIANMNDSGNKLAELEASKDIERNSCRLHDSPRKASN